MHTQKGDFVELVFTGRVNGAVFDSNNPEDLKQLNPDHKPRKTIAIVGEHMVVPGLDEALVGKELNKQFKIHVLPQKGFGERKTTMVRPVPLKVFTSQRIVPEPGMTLLLDQTLVTIRAVSGARVTVDFNNPLAGKELDYEVTIIRKIEDVKEKAELFFEWYMRSKPEIEVRDKVIVKAEKNFEPIINLFKEKFKQIVGVELGFELKESAKPDTSNAQQGTQ